MRANSHCIAGNKIEEGRAENQFPDFVRYIVRRLKTLSPSMGKLKIAETLCRTRLHLGVTTVGQILKKEPQSDPGDAAPSIDVVTVYRAPPNRQWDALGIGVASGDPSDAAKREEILPEIFRRIQLIPFVAVTPDIHFVFDPSGNPARARIVFVGIRLQLDF